MTASCAQFVTNGAAIEDLHLVHASQNGDASAFEELVKRYERKLLRIVHRVTNNWEDSQDVVQETFLKVFQHLGKFREDAKFSTWLFRIAVNQALMKLRSRKTIDITLNDALAGSEATLLEDVPDRARSPEECCRISEVQVTVMKTSERLDPRLRTVFVLRDIEGLSIEETAVVLDITHTTVKTRLRRARLCLRTLLKERFKRREGSTSKSLVRS